MNLPCDYLVFDICYGYHACKCSNGYQRVTQGMAEREREISELHKAKNHEIRDDLSNEIIDIDFPRNDEELLQYVIFTAGVLLLVCSLPCLCIYCCCCRRKRMKLCAGEYPQQAPPRRNQEVNFDNIGGEQNQVAVDVAERIVINESIRMHEEHLRR